MCEYLFKVQQKNRLRQTGLLKRFSIDCMEKKLRNNARGKSGNVSIYEKKNKKIEWWFLRYILR